MGGKSWKGSNGSMDSGTELPALECVIFEAVWFLSVECWEIWSLSFSTKEYPMPNSMSRLAHTGIGHFSAGRCQALQQGCATGTGGTDGAEFPACSQPCPPAPHWAKPASHTAIASLQETCHDCQNRGVAIPFSTGGAEFCQEFWLANWGQKEAPAWGMLVSSLPMQSCSWHLSGTPEPRGRCGDDRLRNERVCGDGWGIQGFALSPAAFSLGCLCTAFWHRVLTPQGKGSPCRPEVIQSLNLFTWAHISAGSSWEPVVVLVMASGECLWPLSLAVPPRARASLLTPVGNYFDPWSCNWHPHSWAKCQSRAWNQSGLQQRWFFSPGFNYAHIFQT